MSRESPNSSVRKLIDFVARVARKPRTKAELVELLHPMQEDTVLRYLRAMIDEGLVQRAGRGDKGRPFVYSWIDQK